jgi:hypothetical protein
VNNYTDIVSIFLTAGVLGMRRPRRSVEPTAVDKSIWEPTQLSSKTQMMSDGFASDLLQDGRDSFLWPLPGHWSVLLKEKEEAGRWIVKREIVVVPILS